MRKFWRSFSYERGNYPPADHSYVRLYKREAPAQDRFVVSRRPPRRLLVASRGDVSRGVELWTSILFECCVCDGLSRWTPPGRVSVDVSPRESGGVLLHTDRTGQDRTAFRLTMRSHPRPQSLSVVTPIGCCCIRSPGHVNLLCLIFWHAIVSCISKPLVVQCPQSNVGPRCRVAWFFEEGAIVHSVHLLWTGQHFGCRPPACVCPSVYTPSGCCCIGPSRLIIWHTIASCINKPLAVWCPP